MRKRRRVLSSGKVVLYIYTDASLIFARSPHRSRTVPLDMCNVYKKAKGKLFCHIRENYKLLSHAKLAHARITQFSAYATSYSPKCRISSVYIYAMESVARCLCVCVLWDSRGVVWYIYSSPLSRLTAYRTLSNESASVFSQSTPCVCIIPEDFSRWSSTYIYARV